VGKIKNVPITITGPEKTPIIEYLVSLGRTDEEILEIFKKEIKKKNIVSFYMHDLFEARFKLKVLEEIFKLILREKLKIKRVLDY
jgi:hypothetical protein